MNRKQRAALTASTGALVVVVAMVGFALSGSGIGGDHEPASSTAADPTATPSAPTTLFASPSTAGTGAGAVGSDDRRGSGDGAAGDAGGHADSEDTGGTSMCGTGEFQVGEWEVPGDTDPGTASGIEVTGDDDCARLRIRFDGSAPGIRVWRPSDGNHTLVSMTPRRDVEPHGPVSPDLLWPELDQLSTAILTSNSDSMAVLAVHGDREDLAARAVPAAQHVDVYFRQARPDDPVVEDWWPGGPHHLEVTGAPDQGLIVTMAAGYEGDWVAVQGYAKAPESHVVVRVHEADGDGVICDDHQMAAGPPYLFSWFRQTCTVPRPGDYQVEVGWPDPAGTEYDVWQWYDVTAG